MEPAVSSEPIPIDTRVRIIAGAYQGYSGVVSLSSEKEVGFYHEPTSLFIYAKVEDVKVIPGSADVSPKSHWKPGDKVRVLDGSRKGQVAEVKGFDGNGHAVVAFEDGDSSPYLDFWLKAASDVPDRPGVADTLEGIAAWQREAPMDRDVLIHLKGHTVTATASLLAGSTEAFSGKFLSDYTPEAAFACMDAIVMQRSRVPIVFGARPEPPLGDRPYVAEED